MALRENHYPMDGAMNNDHPLCGKTVLVTGASSGIGKAVALELAGIGAKVVVGGRNPSRCHAIRRAIAAVTGQEPDGLYCNFLSLDSVREAAKQYIASGRPLDVLINNAGALFTRRTETCDGYEASFGVNHLAPFLLTGMLLPRLKESAPSRIVVVASDAHRFFGPLDFDDLHLQKSYGAFKAYGRSKGANILFTRGLAQHLEHSGITVNAMHPGAVKTNLGTIHSAILKKLVYHLVRPFLLTPQKGAETVLWLASSPKVQNKSGGYYMHDRPHRPRPWTLDEERLKTLWHTSEKLTDFHYHLFSRNFLSSAHVRDREP